MSCKCFPVSIHEKKEKQERDSNFNPFILFFSVIKTQPRTRRGAQRDEETTRSPNNSQPSTSQADLRAHQRHSQRSTGDRAGGSANRARGPEEQLRNHQVQKCRAAPPTMAAGRSYPRPPGAWPAPSASPPSPP